MSLSFGVLGHGLPVTTVDWERLVWGCPEEQRMGTLPMMVRSAFRTRFDCFTGFVLGGGSSQLDDGRFESEVTYALFVERTRDLLAFDQIRNLPALQVDGTFERLAQLIRDAFIDIISTDTAQEIRQAARFFTRTGVNEVVHVTCASRAPDCIAKAIMARDNGIIPADQDWTLVPDHMKFVGTEMSDVIVIEPPYRRDDPRRDAPLKPHEVFRRIAKLPGTAAEQHVLGEADTLLRSYGV